MAKKNKKAAKPRLDAEWTTLLNRAERTRRRTTAEIARAFRMHEAVAKPAAGKNRRGT